MGQKRRLLLRDQNVKGVPDWPPRCRWQNKNCTKDVGEKCTTLGVKSMVMPFLKEGLPVITREGWEGEDREAFPYPNSHSLL